MKFFRSSQDFTKKTFSKCPIFLKGLSTIAVIFLTFLYIYQQVDAVKISYEIKSNKEKLTCLKKENFALEYKLALLISPQNLEKEIKQRDIQLCWEDNPEVMALAKRQPLKNSQQRAKGKIEERYFAQGFLKGLLLSREAEAEQR
ncbi:MAG: hypothetical protein KAS87_02505 [Candidatus Omnitrophica bacterium]|nr:hypothetical protein [Candidatus Omnitrophota bacterium]